MKLRWNEELKKVLLCLCIFVALSLVLLNLGLGIFRNQMRRDYTTLAAGVLENVLRLYPQVSEEGLLQLLDQPKTTGEGEALLARYGIFTEYGSRTLEGKEKRLHFFVLGMNLFLAGILALGAGGILIYLRRRQQRIRELQHYMERLSRGDYCLELEENGDDELSGLRNEIYRLTVLLKESAALEQRRRRALADSVADISHQLKTPLTSMTILMDNLLADQEMDKITRHHFLSEVSRQLTGMSWLIATMLKLSRLEAGVVELGREPVEAARLVEECAARLQTAAEWRDVSLEMRLQPGASLTADEKWTLEALCNIVKNAIEHSPGGSRVQIETAENEIYTEIRVTDSGTGISREERQKLFQRFYRGGNAAEDSVGIGLALAKEVVEQQHGHIQVDSEEGKGTVFSLKFMK
ncbi:alkaline phosphatase synthesis sensor protein PhoR [Lachnospiraceae bacterium]|nr:HAMP domain-containing sensor histidine kinase [Acetatifactor sp.]GFH97605.1 alkaline phosphatase synthesis sensor protein PhoR [Lachnospiraceae bacterium]